MTYFNHYAECFNAGCPNVLIMFPILNVGMPDVIMLSVILNGAMPDVVMLNVAAPSEQQPSQK